MSETSLSSKARNCCPTTFRCRWARAHKAKAAGQPEAKGRAVKAKAARVKAVKEIEAKVSAAKVKGRDKDKAKGRKAKASPAPKKVEAARLTPALSRAERIRELRKRGRDSEIS